MNNSYSKRGIVKNDRFLDLEIIVFIFIDALIYSVVMTIVMLFFLVIGVMIFGG